MTSRHVEQKECDGESKVVVAEELLIENEAAGKAKGEEGEQGYRSERSRSKSVCGPPTQRYGHRQRYQAGEDQDWEAAFAAQLPYETSANFVDITGADEDGVRCVDVGHEEGERDQDERHGHGQPERESLAPRRQYEERCRDQEGVLLGENGQGDQHARSDPPTAQHTCGGRQGETQRHEVLGVECVLDTQPHGRETSNDHECCRLPAATTTT